MAGLIYACRSRYDARQLKLGDTQSADTFLNSDGSRSTGASVSPLGPSAAARAIAAGRCSSRSSGLSCARSRAIPRRRRSGTAAPASSASPTRKSCCRASKPDRSS